ncbi:MAG: methyltransferase domain-containing protein [Planctomycetaceae bacterium]
MQEWPSDILACPDCHGTLTVDAADTLSCGACRVATPSVDGIPRFVSQQHLASFGLQWNRYEVAHDQEDRDTFQAKTGVSADALRGLRVLDAGCGGGRYTRLASLAGASVCAADQSTAVEKAQQLAGDATNTFFLQADLKRLPFRPAAFDFVFSIGVMHHDVETRAVFDAVASMVKPGGRLAVWLYRRNQFWQEWLNNRLRGMTVSMAPDRLERWCRVGAWLGGIPIINQTLNKIVNFSSHPCWENRVCDTFDWYAPDYQHHHTVNELCSWFQSAGFHKLQVLPPEKTGRVYRWAYRRNLLIGSGVNVIGQRHD